VQQTALVLWEKFDAYDPDLPFTPWACRFALNKTRQWLERRQRWQALLAGGLAEELALRREELRPEFICAWGIWTNACAAARGAAFAGRGLLLTPKPASMNWRRIPDELCGHLQAASAGTPGPSRLHPEGGEADGLTP
jgi:hypothetical protein